MKNSEKVWDKMRKFRKFSNGRVRILERCVRIYGSATGRVLETTSPCSNVHLSVQSVEIAGMTGKRSRVHIIFFYSWWLAMFTNCRLIWLAWSASGDERIFCGLQNTTVLNCEIVQYILNLSNLLIDCGESYLYLKTF